MSLSTKLGYIIIAPICLLILFLYSIVRAIFMRKKPNKIIFGTTPILNNKYWANALKEIGLEAETLMSSYYSRINKREDFDKYFEDLLPRILRKKYLKEAASLLFVWLYIIKNTKIFVMSFDGVIFRKYFWRFEYLLFRINKIKTIVIPYGSDAYMYSRVRDKSLQNALLLSYPSAAKREKEIESKVFFWTKRCDFTLSLFMGCDGFPRWDIPMFQFIVIDTKEWQPKKYYSMNDGINGAVRILHAPNHRGFKGTEFLLDAVEKLKNEEGLLIELILLEGVQNAVVKEVMQSVDILAEQFICIGYALTAIEGMASGLPVLSNLDNEEYTKLFRRYSFLNECPILSTTPETLRDNLRLLVTNPNLRKELGLLGRRYVEKYHSYRTAQYLFTHIFKKFEGEDVDLMNLFHPLKSNYVKNDYIKTPLVNNHYIFQ